MLKKKYDDSDMKKNMKKQYGKEEGEKVYYATIRKQAMEQIRNPNTGLPMGLKSTSDTKKDQKLKKVPYEMLRAHLEIPVTDIQVSTMDELTDYRSFAAAAREARDRKAKRREEKQKADKEYMSKKKERVQKGIKFYDTKGKGYVKGGVKTYEETLDEISPANPARIKQPNPYSLSKKLKMIIRSIGAGPIKEKKLFPDGFLDKYKHLDPTKINDFKKLKILLRKQQQNDKAMVDVNPNVQTEGSLHKWFSGSKSKDGKGGWVNVVTGGTCASDEPGEGTPKCVSSSKRASMTKAERLSAARRKKKADPGQQQKSGAAKPTYVPTDKPKKKMKEENQITEADKKGKGSGTKDACYHKVKSRYSVWPSAYASGALVKCRKVGAANWGNSKKEEFEGNISYTSFMEKCWKGYEKKGMKTMFGKRYPNCVKKEEIQLEDMTDADFKKLSKSMYDTALSGGAASQGIQDKYALELARRRRINSDGTVSTMANEGRMSSSNDMQSKMYADKNKSGKKMSDDEIKKEKGGSDFLARIKAAKEKMKNEGSSYGIYKGDGKPKGAMANFGDDKKKKKKSYEEFQQECWKTHKQVGYKKKGGKMVPNCVPKNEEVEITDVKKLSEDDMKGMSVKSGHKRPTKSGAGMTAKGIAAYRRRNPGSKLKGAVTGKVKKGSKAAKRRKSYCARSAGQMKKFPKAAKDPNSRLRQARRRWKC